MCALQGTAPSSPACNVFCAALPALRRLCLPRRPCCTCRLARLDPRIDEQLTQAGVHGLAVLAVPPQPTFGLLLRVEGVLAGQGACAAAFTSGMHACMHAYKAVKRALRRQACKLLRAVRACLPTQAAHGLRPLVAMRACTRQPRTMSWLALLARCACARVCCVLSVPASSAGSSCTYVPSHPPAHCAAVPVLDRPQHRRRCGTRASVTRWPAARR